MAIELLFPIELVLEGVPISSQASPRSRNRWRTTVAGAARASQPPGYWLTERPVAVTVFYFPDTRMEGDIDNIVKPILDALSRTVYIDDHQVERVVVQKFEPGRTFVLSDPTPKLLECADLSGPRIYIRLDDLGAGVF